MMRTELDPRQASTHSIGKAVIVNTYSRKADPAPCARTGTPNGGRAACRLAPRSRSANPSVLLRSTVRTCPQHPTARWKMSSCELFQQCHFWVRETGLDRGAPDGYTDVVAHRSGGCLPPFSCAHAGSAGAGRLGYGLAGAASRPRRGSRVSRPGPRKTLVGWRRRPARKEKADEGEGIAKRTQFGVGHCDMRGYRRVRSENEHPIEELLHAAARALTPRRPVGNRPREHASGGRQGCPGSSTGTPISPATRWQRTAAVAHARTPQLHRQGR